MDATSASKAVQAAVNSWDGTSPKLEVDGHIGKISQIAIATLAGASNARQEASQLPVWPYKVAVDGLDLIITKPVLITSFGGNGDGTKNDPQDSGNTSSGKNTVKSVVDGVALAMDSRQFPEMQKRDPAGYHALYAAPFPRIPWGTKVSVTIKGITYTPQDGVVDLGPGFGASDPGEPHGCDLTIPAVRLSGFAKGWSNKKIAGNFEEWGIVRVIGAAQYLPRFAS